MILLPLCSLDHRERVLEVSRPLALQLLPAVLSLALKPFFHSELEENEVCSFGWLFWGTVWLLFILCHKDKSVWGFFLWCVVGFFSLLYLIYSLVITCQLHLPSGKTNLWMQSEGHRE